jgi:hypothetical protein
LVEDIHMLTNCYIGRLDRRLEKREMLQNHPDRRLEESSSMELVFLMALKLIALIRVQ